MTPPRRLVVLTGAGISRESGLDTFRDQNGLWKNVSIEDVATPNAYRRDPARVHAFYNARRAQLDQVAPNNAHLALARLEREFPGELLVVTQNVDDLHERAGSQALVHMHGTLRHLRCTACSAVHRWDGPADTQTPCPNCCRPALRPDVVWFGEMPRHMDRIDKALRRCDLFVSIGTSGTVYPAAGFVELAGERAPTLELNLEPTGGWSRFDESRLGPAGELVPAWVEDVLSA